MIISHRKKFIFIHNYKVAGTSIRNALDKYNNKSPATLTTFEKLKCAIQLYPKIFSKNFSGHSKAEEIKETLPSRIFDSYYKFGFVRNPWDWQVSLYTFMLKEKNHHQHTLVKSFANFDEYIDWRVHEDLTLQKSFFYSNDEFLMDFVGKFENLEEDFSKVCKRLKLDATLPYLNKSREDNRFVNFYSKNSFEMILQAYKEDIDLFGYQKPIL